MSEGKGLGRICATEGWCKRLTYMKRYVLGAMIVAFSFLILEGCTNEPMARNARDTRASNTNPNERVYSQQDLERTGETQVGPALEKADPDIRSNGR